MSDAWKWRDLYRVGSCRIHTIIVITVCVSHVSLLCPCLNERQKSICVFFVFSRGSPPCKDTTDYRQTHEIRNLAIFCVADFLVFLCFGFLQVTREKYSCVLTKGRHAKNAIKLWFVEFCVHFVRSAIQRIDKLLVKTWLRMGRVFKRRGKRPPGWNTPMIQLLCFRMAGFHIFAPPSE
jgi:hypothetical protein